MHGKQTYSQVNSKTKIDFEEIRFEELEPLVAFGFGSDPELIEKYQQIPGDFKTMVDRNIKNIAEADTILDLRFFKVMFNEIIIGFTVVDFGKNILFSFGINVKYRTKEILIEWIEEIKVLLNGLVRVLLWKQNKRAIEFLKKNAFEVSNETDIIVYLMYI